MHVAAEACASGARLFARNLAKKRERRRRRETERRQYRGLNTNIPYRGGTGVSDVCGGIYHQGIFEQNPQTGKIFAPGA